MLHLPDIALIAAMVLVPAAYIPKFDNGKTLVKRCILYVLCGLIWTYWIWNGFDINLNPVNTMALTYLGYCFISVTWAVNQDMASRDAIQQAAFVTMFFAAQKIDPVPILIIAILAGLFVGIWGFYDRDGLSKESCRKLHGFTGLLFTRKKGGQLGPLGNGCAASFYLMTLTLLSVYLCLMTFNAMALIPFLIGVVWLGLCKNKGALGSMVAGCVLYTGFITLYAG